MKTLIAINNLTMMDQLAYANHCQFWYNLGRKHPEDDFGLCNPRRMSIDHMRNFAAKAALELNFDYLIFVDDDVLLPMDFYKRLKAADKDIVAGVTLIRGYPYHPMIFNFYKQLVSNEASCHFIDDYKERADPETGLLRCDAVGFSCCMIKTSVLRKMEPPYFITGPRHTEDVYFCNRARNEVGAEVWVDVNVKTAHILGSEIIEPDNLGPRLAFDEATNPGIAERCRNNDERVPILDPRIMRKVDHAQQVREKIFG